MTQQVVNTGTFAGDGTGSKGQVPWNAFNSNSTELYGTAFFFGVDSGAANAYVVTLASLKPNPAVAPTLAAGLTLRFTPTHPNTGPATLNVAGTGVVAIVNAVGAALAGGELILSPTVLEYNGTAWQLLNTGLGAAVFPYPQTPIEAAASVTPVSLQYPPYWSFRYMTAAQIADVLAGSLTQDCTAALETCLNFANPVVMTGKYDVSSVSLSTTGSNKTILFQPGCVISSNQAAANNPVLNFLGVGDHLTIQGNGVQVGYATVPVTRINHCIFFNGATITNLDVGGIEVFNSGNIAIYVVCGLNYTLASGSTRIFIHDCKVYGSLGDGVHVQNADSDVRIWNIEVVNPGDDCIAVTQYTITGTAPSWNLGPTIGVLINNLKTSNVVTSSVTLLGVVDFIVNNLEEEAQSSVISIKLAGGPGYTVGNIGGVIDNVVTSGAATILAFDTPGSVTSTAGTVYNQNIKVGKVVGHNLAPTTGNRAISCSNAAAASGAAISNISFGDLDLMGTGTAGYVGYFTGTQNCRINSLRASGFGAGLFIASNQDFSWGYIKMQAWAAGTANALYVVTNTNIRPGALEVNAGNCTLGMEFQSNAGVKHDGLWSVFNATTNYSFGSNTAVNGYFLTESVGPVSLGSSVAAATPYTFTYPTAVPTGAAYVLTYSIQTATVVTPVAHALTASSITAGTVYFSGSMASTTYINYTISMQAA